MKNIIISVIILLFASFPAQSQNFWQSLNKVLQETNKQLATQNEVNRLNRIINNSSLQTADMQSYILFLKAGIEAANESNHGDALLHYSECRKVIARTSDADLKKIYNQYGWKDELDKYYTKSYTQFKLYHPGEPIPGTVSTSTTTGGGYGTPYTPTQHANKCGICSSTGKCSNCNGTGISPWSHSTCGACGGRGVCTTCNGTGISGYSYY